jgi:rubrerythrin
MKIPRPVKELLLQALEHEQGGVVLYQTALECAVQRDLRREWEEYLEQTRRHVDILTRVCDALGVDAGEVTPAREIVHQNGKALAIAMKAALASGDKASAELVACDAIVLAETKDHANWELIGACAKELSGDAAAVLQRAHDEVEDEEDEHLYHTKGWCRELWRKFLGFGAVLPPPEEKQDVRTARQAAEVEEQSKVH